MTMRNELDEILKKTLGSLPPLDMERFTDHVMENLKKEIGNKEAAFLRGLFHQLIVYKWNWRGLKTVISGQLALAGQGKPFAGKYATVFKVTAGLVVAVAVVILTLIFIPDYGPSTSGEAFESSRMLNDTLPCYVLNDRINAHIEETRPCDILPPLLD